MSAVLQAGGLARGGAVAAESGDHKAVCDPYEGLVECVKRAGEGDYVLLGKVAGATCGRAARVKNSLLSARARERERERDTGLYLFLARTPACAGRRKESLS